MIYSTTAASGSSTCLVLLSQVMKENAEHRPLPPAIPRSLPSHIACAQELFRDTPGSAERGRDYPTHAQWLSQPTPLKPGWNAVYLHVDASHDTLTNLSPQISTIPSWRCGCGRRRHRRCSSSRHPQSLNGESSQWASWDRFCLSGSSILQRLVAMPLTWCASARTRQQRLDHQRQTGSTELPMDHHRPELTGFPTVAVQPTHLRSVLTPVPRAL